MSCVVVLPLAAGCGGGKRQDADEPSGTYSVDVVKASFPRAQHLAEGSDLVVTVRNTSGKKIPNIAVTIDSFSRTSDQPGLADPQRPVWIVDRGPNGGQTAYVDTWALGPLPAGGVRTFNWHVTAVQPGTHTVHYRVAAGLDGKAKAELGSGGVPEGSFTVDVSAKPAQSRVDPVTGDVIREKN